MKPMAEPMVKAMAGRRRITLVRHGETEGESSIRFHGATDVPLSGFGRAQAVRAREHLDGRAFDLVVSSSLIRAEESARLIVPEVALRIELDFREIDFGRWEGLTIEEIESLDPDLHAEWQARTVSFDFPEGERRGDFRARVLAALERLLETAAGSILIVAHKGVVRTILEHLSGEAPPQPEPELGGVYELLAADTRGTAWSTLRLL